MMFIMISAVGAMAAGEEKIEAAKLFWVTVMTAGFGIAIAAFGTGLAQGNAIRGAVEGTARNPEASDKITVTMLIGLALIESLCIYALVVSLILIYAYPMAEPVAKFLGIAIGG
jgi:F-type H+-transporting ATPase subunit c